MTRLRFSLLDNTLIIRHYESWRIIKKYFLDNIISYLVLLGVGFELNDNKVSIGVMVFR